MATAATEQGNSTNESQGKKYRSPINVNSQLDDYGLDPYEFRVYSHVARRAGKFEVCFAKVDNMAAVCKMSPRKIRYTLKFLCEAGLLLQEDRKRTNNYRLAPIEHWADKQDLGDIRQQVKNGGEN